MVHGLILAKVRSLVVEECENGFKSKNGEEVIN
jgi:hypothetical protein